MFTKAINFTPKRPSLYNNRAQVHRLLGSTLGKEKVLTYNKRFIKIIFTNKTHSF